MPPESNLTVYRKTILNVSNFLKPKLLLFSHCLDSAKRRKIDNFEISHSWKISNAFLKYRKYCPSDKFLWRKILTQIFELKSPQNNRFSGMLFFGKEALRQKISSVHQPQEIRRSENVENKAVNFSAKTFCLDRPRSIFRNIKKILKKTN